MILQRRKVASNRAMMPRGSRRWKRRIATLNSFCPTGAGGGVDPGCSAVGGGSTSCKECSAVAIQSVTGKLVDDKKRTFSETVFEIEDRGFKRDLSHTKLWRGKTAREFDEKSGIKLGLLGVKDHVMPIIGGKLSNISGHGEDAIEAVVSFEKMPGLRRNLEANANIENRLVRQPEVFPLPVVRRSVDVAEQHATGSGLLINTTRNGNRSRPNPLRIDPTRTSGVRRRFGADIKRRLAALKVAIRKFLVTDDELGLVTNSFCPTGEGGGVDPSCSPSSKLIEAGTFVSRDAAKASYREATDKLFESVTQRRDDYSNVEIAGDKFLTTVLKENFEGGQSRFNVRIDFGTRGRSDTFTGSKMDSSSLGLLRKVRDAVVAYRKAGFRIEVGASDARRKQLYEKHLQRMGLKKVRDGKDEVWNVRLNAIDNAFCPIGEGGGVDPSCSPSAGPTTRALVQALREHGYYLTDQDETVKRIIAAGIKEGTRGHESAMRKMDFDPNHIDSVLRRAKAIKREMATNAFCPTGPGGGQDNSCSPGKGASEKEPTIEGFPSGQPTTLDASSNPAVLDKFNRAFHEAVEEADTLYRGVTMHGGLSTLRSIRDTGRLESGGWGMGEKKFEESSGETSLTISPLVAGTFTGSSGAADGLIVAFDKNKLRGEVKPLTYEPGASNSIMWEREVRAFDVTTDLSAVRSVTVQKVSSEFASRKDVQEDRKSADEVAESMRQEFGIKVHVFHRWSGGGVVANAQTFRFSSSPEKLAGFRRWLAGQMKLQGLLFDEHKTGERQWWERYIREVYEQGHGRAYDDMNRSKKVRDYAKDYAEREPGGKYRTAEGGYATEKPYDFYAAGKESFLRDSFGRPASVERVQQLASRTFTDLKGFSDDMATKINRTLTDSLVHGLIRGKSPREMVGDITDRVDVSESRALTIARTECLPAETVVDSAVVRAVFRRWYDGNMVEITTRAGRKFSATPNHPMLTQNGWVGAGLLKQGDNLVCNNGQEDSGSYSDPNVDREPATIGEIYDSLAAVAVSQRRLASDEDFHGDGLDGEVDVLCPDRELRIGNFAPLRKPLAEQVFSPAGLAASSFCGLCGRLLSVNPGQRLCECSQRDPACYDASLDRSGVYSETIGDAEGRLTGSVAVGDVVGVQVEELVRHATLLPSCRLGFASRSDFPAESAHDLQYPLVVMAEPPGDLLGRDSRGVELDQIELVRVRQFSGHVFNLETSFGYFTIDSLYTGNTIRAHAEGQLDGLERLGVEEVGVAVEWSTSGLGETALGHASPCEVCEPMEGTVLKLDEARGMIPRHPNCMCSWIPANVGEDGSDQNDTRSGIERAIRDSLDEEGGAEKSSWGGADADAEISERRPTGNIFCRTGPGGGVDPTCGAYSGDQSRDDVVERWVAGVETRDDMRKLVRREGKVHAEVYRGELLNPSDILSIKAGDDLNLDVQSFSESIPEAAKFANPNEGYGGTERVMLIARRMKGYKIGENKGDHNPYPEQKEVVVMGRAKVASVRRRGNVTWISLIGADAEIDEKRPTGNASPELAAFSEAIASLNAFCPGEGARDNSCSSRSGSYAWKTGGTGDLEIEVDGVRLALVNLTKEIGKRQWNLGVVSKNGDVEWVESAGTKVEIERWVSTVLKNEKERRLADNAFSKTLAALNAGDNCGIGPEGFEPGNTCAKGRGNGVGDRVKIVIQHSQGSKIGRVSSIDKKGLRTIELDDGGVTKAWDFDLRGIGRSKDKHGDAELIVKQPIAVSHSNFSSRYENTAGSDDPMLAIGGESSEGYKELQNESLDRQRTWIESGSKEEKMTATLAKNWTHSDDVKMGKVYDNPKYIVHIRSTAVKNEKDLYRGLDFEKLDDRTVANLLKAKAGDLLPEMKIASFTEDQGWAERFSGNEGVTLKLSKGSGKSLGIQHVSNSIAEREHVVSGLYRVKSVGGGVIEIEEILSTTNERFEPGLGYPLDGGLLEEGGVVTNAFCPTGEGGGVDPGCSPGSSGGLSVGQSVMYKGERYVVSGGGMAKTRGKDKGRIRVVMRLESDQSVVVADFADQVQLSSDAKSPPAGKSDEKRSVTSDRPSKSTESLVERVIKQQNTDHARASVDDVRYALKLQGIAVDRDAVDKVLRDKLGGAKPAIMRRLEDQQIEEGNRKREAAALPTAKFELKHLPLGAVTPSQTGEDYDNDSSRELARHIGKFGSSGRYADYAPIVVDEDMKIRDGNHRHAARAIAGIKTIPVLVPVSGTSNTLSEEMVALNAFCPTGEGGGVDPTCSPRETSTTAGEKLHGMVREGKSWKTLDGKDVPEHVAELAIPPAWRDAYFNPDSEGDLLARGTDAKGRTQMKYSDSHNSRAAAAKFGRVAELRAKREEIFKEVARDAKDPALKENADVLKVVMQTGIRPGSTQDTGADFKSFGATTLEGRHVVADKDETKLKFVTGKNKGRAVEFPIKDQATAKMLRDRAEKAGANGKLFNTDAQALRDYSKSKDGGGFKTKDHRTALGTETAIREINNRETVPKTMKEYKAAVKEVATVVAKTLGNTPSVALKSYIDPTVFSKWRLKE